MTSLHSRPAFLKMIVNGLRPINWIFEQACPCVLSELLFLILK